MLKLIELYRLRIENRKLKTEFKALSDAFESLAKEAAISSIAKQVNTIKICALEVQVDSLARKLAAQEQK